MVVDEHARRLAATHRPPTPKPEDVAAYATSYWFVKETSMRLKPQRPTAEIGDDLIDSIFNYDHFRFENTNCAWRRPSLQRFVM